MILYPYSTPVVMTDEIYARLGGNVDTTSPDLRQMAYLVAESAIYYDLETPLILTTFTGSYPYAPYIQGIMLDHSWVSQAIRADVLDKDRVSVLTLSGSNLHLDYPEYGVLSLGREYLNYCQSIYGSGPYDLRVVYTAGFSSGTSYDPRILLGLTKYATIQINEMIGFGNESSGDIGVKTFKNMEYFEQRVDLLRTAYGNSAVANYIHHLLAPFRKRRHVGM